MNSFMSSPQEAEPVKRFLCNRSLIVYSFFFLKATPTAYKTSWPDIESKLQLQQCWVLSCTAKGQD